MNIDLNDSIKKLKRRYYRDNIENDIIFNNYLDCAKIQKNINQVLDDNSLIEKELRLIELFSEINKNTEEEIYEIYLSIEKKIFYNVHLEEYNWFKNIISITENIPISITISSSRKENFGFPLVYVNKQFEKMTGYNRNEIIGLNCKFLQPIIPILQEETQHKLIKNCLKLGFPTSVIITNIKKNGSIFNNLITLKPVIDEDGKYLYCIGIQTEIIKEHVNKIDIQNITDLINILSKNKLNIIRKNIK